MSVGCMVPTTALARWDRGWLGTLPRVSTILQATSVSGPRRDRVPTGTARVPIFASTAEGPGTARSTPRSVVLDDITLRRPSPTLPLAFGAPADRRGANRRT